VGSLTSASQSYHPLPNRAKLPLSTRRHEPRSTRRQQNRKAFITLASSLSGLLMRRFIVLLSLLSSTLWAAPSQAQQRSQLGPLCTTDTTPAD
jgi:hypothetical protein